MPIIQCGKNNGVSHGWCEYHGSLSAKNKEETVKGVKEERAVTDDKNFKKMRMNKIIRCCREVKKLEDQNILLIFGNQEVLVQFQWNSEDRAIL